MPKKRNTTKPKGTFSSEEVTNLFIAMWDMRDALASGDHKKIDAAFTALWGCIPNTTTNSGARTRARYLRRKRDEAESAAPAPNQPAMRNFSDLSDAEKAEGVRRLKAILDRLVDPADQPAPETKPDVDTAGQPGRLPTQKMRKTLGRFDELSDEEQIAHLRQMWESGGA